ncbi:MAG: hypothetical protein MSE70_08755 [Streptococcus sp.]|uniref:hypothetical protein n=1 Tax=Streptococcus sp. TaxID=1306 RepID=UPI00258E7B02|nr:hypothetical protein [Streptococcus sp.]MCI7517108.1 hypothetical protein [Streptococcus sp.]MDY5269565.1 hypothetical protein [Streptococcus sp.]
MIVNELKKRSEIFVEKIVEDDFIQGMITEKLPAEAICHYLKADSVYLDKFADSVTRSTPKAVGITDKSVA